MRPTLAIFILLLAACGAEPDPAANAAGDASAGDAEPVVDTRSEGLNGPALPTLMPAAIAAAGTISGDTILSVVREIADDRYGGREPGTEGDRMTRAYLAGRLEAAGYLPAAPTGGFDQRFDLVGVEARQPATWSFAASSGDITLSQGSDFVVFSGVQADRTGIPDGTEAVFVGFGMQAPEYDWDDFKGADLRGKLLVMLNNDPDWDPDLFAGERRLYYGRWTYKLESAARQGAAGAVILHTDQSAGYGWPVVQNSWTRPQFELPAGDEPRLAVAGWLAYPAAERLFEAAGHDLAALESAARTRDFEPVSLGVTTGLAFDNALTQVSSGNVLGMLPGGDPELMDEVVVYTAHHDHLGTDAGGADGEDIIYNGARDNASGTGMVLAIAEAFAALPERPRRSILIAFVGAEETGLLGSQYLAAHLPVPPGRVAANVNYDSGNIWGETTDITYVGMNKSTLDAVALAVAEYQQRTVTPDQSPDKGFFYRSDNFSLARIGVPALYLKAGSQFVGRPEGWGDAVVGEHSRAHYHRPSDEWNDDWTADGMVLDAAFGFLAGWLVANADAMPAWYPGDEFEAARLEALQAVLAGED